MSIQITPKMVNNFNSVRELRAHKSMKKIEKDVSFVLDAFQRLDNSSQDGNQASGKVVLDRAYSTHRGPFREDYFSEMTGVLQQGQETTSFEASAKHSQRSSGPIPASNRGQMQVTMRESAEEIVYQSLEGQFTLDKTTGTRTLREFSDVAPKTSGSHSFLNKSLTAWEVVGKRL
jgi:hypothetical protein